MAVECSAAFPTIATTMTPMNSSEKPSAWAALSTEPTNASLAQNGVGKFADIDEVAIAQLAEFGVTHVWLTGVLRQATLTNYNGYGMPADDPDTVKGRAGSFYAIRDYYDVSPDYAMDPTLRLEEFDALVARHDSLHCFDREAS